jgi:hypothetical protein
MLWFGESNILSSVWGMGFLGVWGMGLRAWDIKKAQRIAGAIAAPGGRIGVKIPIARRFYFYGLCVLSVSEKHRPKFAYRGEKPDSKRFKRNERDY